MRTTSTLHLQRKRKGMVRKRLVWVGAIALLVVAGAAAVAGAQEPEYVDDDGSVHEGSLRLLQQVGVLAGLECGPAAICPKDLIDRTMMAVWVIRARDHVLVAGQEPGRAEWEPHPGLEDLSGYSSLSNRFADLGASPICVMAVSRSAVLRGDLIRLPI